MGCPDRAERRIANPSNLIRVVPAEGHEMSEPETGEGAALSAREAEVLGRGARALGLTTGPVPLLINSVPRDGRAECVRCGQCVGFA